MNKVIEDVSISSLLHFIPNGIIITDLDGNILLANQRAEEIFDYRENELIDQPIEVLIPARFKAHAMLRQKFVQNLKAIPTREDLDLFGLHRDGTEFPISISLGALKTENGTLIIVTISDLSERRRMENIFKERNQRYSALFNHSSEAVLIISLEGILLDVNINTANMLGFSLEELIGMSIKEIVSPQGLPEAMRKMEKLISGEQLPIFECLLHRKDNTEFPVEIKLLLVRDENGQPQYIQCIMHDISARKQTEKSLRYSERYNRLLFWQSPIGLALVKMNGDLVDVNPAFAGIIGYSVEEVAKFSYWDITPESYAEQELEQLDSLRKTGRYGPYEKEYIHKDGHLVPVRLQGMLLQREDETFIWSSVEDITKRKKAEDEILKLNKELEDRVQQRTLELKESETRYRLFSENASDMLWSMDMEGNFTYVSPAIERYSGFTVEEYCRLHFSDVLLPKSLDKATIVFNEILETAAIKKSYTLSSRLELEHFRKDGSTYWADVVPSIIYDDAREPLGIMGVSRDISDNRELQKILKESEARYRAVVEDQTEYISRWKPDGTLTFVNKRYAELFNEPVEKLVGSNFFSLISEKSRGIIKENIKSLSPENPVFEDEYFSYSLMRKGRWFRWIQRGIFDQEGRLEMIQSIGSDITERKLTEEALRSSETLFRAISEQTGEGITLADPDGKYVMVNPHFCQITGYSEAELLKLKVFDLVPEESEPLLFPQVKTGKSGSRELYLKKKDGSVFLAEIRGYPISLENRLMVLGIIRDITELKKTETELRLLSASLIAAANAIVITEPDGTIIWVNPAFTYLTGYSLDEAVGNNPRVLNSGHQDNAFFKDLWDTITSGQVWHGELINKRKDEKLYDEEMTITPLKDLNGDISHFIAIKQDISQRKQIEESLIRKTTELKRSNELISTLTQMAAKSQAIVAPEKFFRSMEDELKQLGLKYCVAVFAPDNQNLRLQHVGIGKKALEVAEKLLGGDAGDVKIKKEALPLHTKLFDKAQPVMVQDISQMLKVMFPSFSDTIVNKLSKIVGGGSGVSNLFLPLISEDLVIGLLSVWGKEIKEEDIPAFSIFAAQVANAIRVAELYQQAQAANVAKTEFLSQMSHELRTPLNSILGFAQLMDISKKEPLSENQRLRVGQIVDGGTHLLNLINEILDLSRIEAGRLAISPEPINVQDAIIKVGQLAKPLADSQDIQLKIAESDGDVYVQADNQRLKQVLLNLLSNAIKYNRPGGWVKIDHNIQSDGYLRISVSDSGKGIPPELLEKLFNPFERLGAETSEVEGTGLGLALSKHLVELMGGKIDVQTVVGKGSTFWVEFPMIDDPLKQKSKKQKRTVGNLNANDMKVLYIEDNPANYELVHQIMVEYPQVELHWETNPRSGIDSARNQQYDLILLDLHLPGMNGDEVLKRLKSDYKTSSVPVVVLSADATHNHINEMIALGADAYLTKPLNVKEFITLIDDHLKGK